MELHSPINSVMAKRLWNFLRIAFFMMRKGLISKRKLIMDMNLMMKRGKVLGKTLGNLMFHHHSRSAASHGFSMQEYEFSCSNSPNPVFFHAGKRKHHHHYFPSIAHFPCINGQDDPDEKEEPRPVILLPNIEYSPEWSYNLHGNASDLAPGEMLSSTASPLSIRVSNYSLEEEDNDGGIKRQVDDEAEEFIRRFYEQLRIQSRTALLQYQESQYQEMLARGTG